MADADLIGRRIASRRAYERWTQTELGQRVGGVNQSTVTRWEAGTLLPSVPQLVKLAEVFGVTEAWLIHGTEGAAVDRALPEPSIPVPA